MQMIDKNGEPSVVIALKSARKKNQGGLNEQKKMQAKTEEADETDDSDGEETNDPRQMMEAMKEKMTEMIGMMEQMQGMIESEE